MPKIIAVSNPKGGVGKTTTTINLAASLAIAEKRVLIMDLDPNGAASSGLGFNPDKIKTGIFEVFSGTYGFFETIHPVKMRRLPNLDIIPCNVVNTEQEIRLLELAKNRVRLKRKINELNERGKTIYDFVVIDTPPALNDLTIASLLAAHSVLIPLQCGYFSLRAVHRLVQVVERIRRSTNPDLTIEGILLNFYEKGTRVCMRSAYEAGMAFQNLLFKTVIPKNVVIGYAAFEKKPVALVDVSASGSLAYMSLAEEILNKYEHWKFASQVPRFSPVEETSESMVLEY